MMARGPSRKVAERRERVAELIAARNDRRPARIAAALAEQGIEADAKAVSNDIQVLKAAGRLPEAPLGMGRKRAGEKKPSSTVGTSALATGTNVPADDPGAGADQPAAVPVVAPARPGPVDPFAALYPERTQDADGNRIYDEELGGRTMFPNHAGKTYPAEPLTAAEVALLVRAASNRAPTGIRNRAIITLMFHTGLRISEILDLKPADVDQVAGTVRVLRGKGNWARTVPADPGALAAVARWMDTRKALGIPGTNPHLFCTIPGVRNPAGGRKMSDHYIRDMLRRYGKRAGLTKRVHPHGLRHGYALHLDHQGVPTSVISKALGHKSVSVTSVYLSNIGAADVQAALRNVEWD